MKSSHKKFRLRLIYVAGVAMAAALTLFVASALAAPSTVYVNAAWAGTSPGTDPDGSGPATAFGTDAFATVQAGVNAVASCGTVSVYNGTYNEDVTVNKCVTLSGAQANNPSTSRSGPESVVGSFHITASNVVMDGFKLSDAGPQLRVDAVSGPTLSGVIARHIIFDGYNDVAVPTYNAGNIHLDDVLFRNPSGTAEAIQIKADSSSVGGCTGSQVSNATFSGATNNGAADANFSCTDSNSTNVSVTDSTSSGNSGGSSFIGLGGVTDLTTSGNTATTDGSTVFVFGGITGTWSSTDDSFTSTTGKAISLHAGDITTDPVNSGTVDVESATLSGSPAVGVSAGAINSSSQVRIHGSSVTGGINNASGVSIDAARNWSGSTSGFGTLTDVITTPWYVNAARTTLSDNANLTGLTVSPGTLSPAFNASTTSYSLDVDNGVSSVNVTPTHNPGATIATSGGSNLAVGSNNQVTITVTSADGSASKTYTVTVNRGAAAPPPATTTTTTTTTTTSTTSDGATVVTTPTGVTVTQTATNQPATTPVLQPTQAGVASVVAQSTTGTGTPSVPIETTWPSGTFTVPVSVKVDPQPDLAGGTSTTSPVITGGFKLGSAVVDITATDSSGQPVTTLEQPMKIHIGASEAGSVPSYSRDGGKTWTAIPRLSSPELPAGQSDGYFVNSDGSVDIYTRHLTIFSALKDAEAPKVKDVSFRLINGKLYAKVIATDNVRVAYYLVSINGQKAIKTVHPIVARKVSNGRNAKVKVIVVDTAGNKTSASSKGG